uniref:Uncharacterized protein n=1 Tax=Parascaris equorum TaxID=6256 RepID=A0A914S995_PAREQ
MVLNASNDCESHFRLTVCVTCQLLALIVWPMMAKNSLTLAKARRIVAIVIVLSIVLHILLLTHRCVRKSICAADDTIVVHYYLSLSERKLI